MEEITKKNTVKLRNLHTFKQAIAWKESTWPIIILTHSYLNELSFGGCFCNDLKITNIEQCFPVFSFFFLSFFFFQCMAFILFFYFNNKNPESPLLTYSSPICCPSSILLCLLVEEMQSPVYSQSPWAGWRLQAQPPCRWPAKPLLTWSRLLMSSLSEAMHAVGGGVYRLN